MKDRPTEPPGPGQSAVEDHARGVRYRAALLLCSLLAACTVDGSLGKTTATEGSSGGGGTGTTGAADDDDAGDSGAAEGDGTGSGGGSGGTTGGEGTRGGDSDATGTGGADACADDASDSPCRQCVKTHCCDALQMCRQSDMCSCYMDCVDGGTDTAQCRHDCGTQTDHEVELAACQHEQCADACG